MLTMNRINGGDFSNNYSNSFCVYCYYDCKYQTYNIHRYKYILLRLTNDKKKNYDDDDDDDVVGSRKKANLLQ